MGLDDRCMTQGAWLFPHRQSPTDLFFASWPGLSFLVYCGCPPHRFAGLNGPVRYFTVWSTCDGISRPSVPSLSLTPTRCASALIQPFLWLPVSSHSPSSRPPCSSALTSCSQFHGSASVFSPVDGVLILCLFFHGSTSGTWTN